MTLRPQFLCTLFYSKQLSPPPPPPHPPENVHIEYTAQSPQAIVLAHIPLLFCVFAVSVSWPGVRGDATLQPLGDVFVCPEAVTSVFTCNVTNQYSLLWRVGLEDSTIDTKFFPPGSLVGATVASSGALPFMAELICHPPSLSN